MSLVRFWGVQGSCPGTQFKDTLGCNTSCVSLEIEKSLVILDSGTGIRSLSTSVDFNNYNQVVLLITHSHWDHIQGFPFFTYLFQKKPLIIYSHKKEHIESLINQINGINFPLTKQELACDIQCINDLEKLNQMVNFNVKTIKANHQGDCIGYRIKKESIDVTYIPDNQLHNETITSFDAFIHFCKDTKLLIHDSQYTETDMPHKIDWGHSIYTDALNLALKANAKTFCLFHHDPTRTKEEIIAIKNHCESLSKVTNIIAAKENSVINLLGN